MGLDTLQIIIIYDFTDNKLKSYIFDVCNLSKTD